MKVKKPINFIKKFTATYNKKPTLSELYQFKEWHRNNMSFNNWNGKEIEEKL